MEKDEGRNLRGELLKESAMHEYMLKPKTRYGGSPMNFSLVPLVLTIGILAGCEESPSHSAPAPSATPQTAEQKPAPPPPPPPPPENEKLAPPAATQAKNPTPEASPIPPGMEQEKAQVGSGEKGRDYGDGIIATPVTTYFKVRERVAYEIQIPKAMQLYEQMEGHAPRSHEEFMEKIVKANSIPLPTLPNGHTYRYDPKEKQLMVVYPKE
jgi:hypothetical protein